MRFKEFACKYLYDSLLDNVNMYVKGYLEKDSIRLYDACSDLDWGKLYVNGVKTNDKGILEINLTFNDEF